jgi:exodeoxyribonuclease VII large subunit
MTTPETQQHILTVTQLNRFIRNWLEQDMGTIQVEGEISNLTQAASGHCYFTLKDSSAQLRCVFFRNRHFTNQTPPQNGQLIIAQGKLSLYEARGDYQLIIDVIEEAGVGELYRAFQLLKTKLAALGLFDAERKKPIPSIPHCIGIVTSPKGAALHDIMTTITRRYPLAQTRLYPSDVQGAQAASQLIQAIAQANHDAQCDVIILARGGGSMEDLWSFNHEALAHAIANSQIPIVSGIGHETDFTIADFVADFRAATPTGAAEQVTPDWKKLEQQFQTLGERLRLAMMRFLKEKQQQLAYEAQKIGSPKRLIETHEQTLDYLTRQLNQLMTFFMTQKKHSLSALIQSLESHSPLATLARGYAVATKEHKLLFTTENLAINDTIDVQLARGQLTCTINKILP